MYRKVLLLALVGLASAVDLMRTGLPRYQPIYQRYMPVDFQRNFPADLKRAGGWTNLANGLGAIVEPVPIAGPITDVALHTAGAVLDGTQAVLENIPIVGPLGGAVLDTAGGLLGGIGETLGGITQGVIGQNGLVGGLLGGDLLGGHGGHGGLLGGNLLGGLLG